MRGKSLAIAATVVAALALPATAPGHPFTTTGHSLFSGEMPTIGFDVGASDVFMRSYYQGGSPPTEYETDDMRFLGFSPRPAPTLGQANSDIAFQGKMAIQGTFQGFRFIDIRNPSNPREIFAFEDCNGEGGQGDIVVYGDVLTRSWDAPAQAGRTCDGKPVPPGWEGLHVFDISDLENPELVAEVRTRCGSHTATGVPDPRNKRLLVYNTPSYSAGNCPNEPLGAAGIQVVEVPLRSPESSRALQFEDAAPNIRCHDTGVILGKILRAACAGGDGIAVWTMDPREGGSLQDPKLEYVRDMRNTGVPDFKVGHSAAWSNDGETLIIGHEPDGGVRARCQPTGTVFADPTANYQVQTDPMKSFFFLDSDTGATKATWTLPRDQTKFENCTLHNYNVVPTKKRDVLVQGSYQSGLGVLDFTNLNRIREVAYADPIPLSETVDPVTNRPTHLGGDWSTHWYNGTVYQSDISRGFLSWRHTDDTFRGATNLSRLNPQTQEYTNSKGRGDDDDDDD